MYAMRRGHGRARRPQAVWKRNRAGLASCAQTSRKGGGSFPGSACAPPPWRRVRSPH